MYQLKNLIEHTSVPSDPHANMNAVEDILLLQLHGHTVAAAETIQECTSGHQCQILLLKDLSTYLQLRLPTSTLLCRGTSITISDFALGFTKG